MEVDDQDAELLLSFARCTTSDKESLVHEFLKVSFLIDIELSSLIFTLSWDVTSSSREHK